MSDQAHGTWHRGLLIFFSLVGGLALFGVYMHWVHELQDLWMRQEMVLPTVSIWMLQLSQITHRFWAPILATIVVGSLGLLAFSPAKAVRLGGAMVSTQLLVALFTIAAMYLPFQMIARATAPGTAAAASGGAATGTPASATGPSPASAPAPR